MNAFWLALLVWQACVGRFGSNPKCREVRVPPSDSAGDQSEAFNNVLHSRHYMRAEWRLQPLRTRGLFHWLSHFHARDDSRSTPPEGDCIVQSAPLRQFSR